MIENNYQLKNKIKQCLKDIKNHLKKSDKLKIQLTITVNFIYSKDDNNEECEVHSKSDNRQIMMNDEADKVIEQYFESLKKRYQNKLEESMRGSEFFFNFLHLLYYKCNKINPNCSGSYIDPPD